MTVNLKSVVSKQLPEFIRADYPAFVEFVEAYYEYLQQTNSRNLEELRDIDSTLDSFIKYFRKELDVYGDQYEHIDPRLFLRKSNQLFTAGGSEAAYKFLFKILFNKEAQIKYPWDEVLKASAGKWQQETSLFVRMSVGDANDLIGNNITVYSGNAKFRIFVIRIDAREDLEKIPAGRFEIGQTYKISTIGTTDFKQIGAADNIVGVSFTATGVGSGTGIAVIDKKLYEVFIDKDYYGNIVPGDTIELIKKEVVFDSILNFNPNLDTITVNNHGLLTGEGVVYTYSGGKSVGGLEANKTYYAIKVDNNTFKLASTYKNALNGVNVQLSSPGIGIYHRLSQVVAGTIIPTASKYTIIRPGRGFRRGSIINAKTISSGKVITQKLKVTRVDDDGGIMALSTITFGYDYGNDFFVLQPSPSGTTLNSSSRISIENNGDVVYALNDDTVVEKYTDFGYIINPNYVEYPNDRPAYSDISYAATLINQYYQEIDTEESQNPNFAIIRFNIGAIASYPGQFITNDGFLNDDMFIQDSFRWQKYSYVITVNEKLDAYKSLVKSILHPGGTELFGEYDISTTNVLDIKDGVFNISACEFIGSIADDILTVINVEEAELFVGSKIVAEGVIDGTYITEFITGTGTTGTYKINKPQTVLVKGMIGYRPTTEGENTQELGQWRSAATFNTINTSITNMFMYPSDDGGYIRIDPFDTYYALPSEIYASETYRFFGDERNILRDTPVLTDSGYGRIQIRFNAASVPTGAVSSPSETISFTTHGFSTGDAVVYNNGGGTTIGGLTNNTTYYIIAIDPDTISLALSYSDAIGNIVKNLSSPGVGLYHTLTKVGTTVNF